MSADDVWTIQRILTWTQQHFVAKGIQSARLDAEVLLASVMGVGRVQLYTNYDQPLRQEERAAFRALVQRRAAREPVAHILGRKEFYSRDFAVTRDVLIPRPETEHLVDAVLEWIEKQELTAPRIVDIGTGSGAIAVTLACELPQAAVVATDVSQEALGVARRNAEKHGVADRIEFLHGDLFESLGDESPRRFDVVVSNPPYVDVEARDVLQPEVRDWEPEVALFAGEGGLAVVQRLCAEVHPHLEAPGLFACEIGYDQQALVVALLADAGPWARNEVLPDLQGHPRVALAERAPKPPITVRKAASSET
ncbi:MAG: peptide chain release factor N(5)-glutamine methyltransferase [Myxococcota bacterium]